MGKIVRDERYTNTLWCLCENEDDYIVSTLKEVMPGAFRKENIR